MFRRSCRLLKLLQNLMIVRPSALSHRFRFKFLLKVLCLTVEAECQADAPQARHLPQLPQNHRQTLPVSVNLCEGLMPFRVFVLTLLASFFAASSANAALFTASNSATLVFGTSGLLGSSSTVEGGSHDCSGRAS